MYLKFIGEYGEVIRYSEAKKRIIIGMAKNPDVSSKIRHKIIVNKHSIDITNDIILLHYILITDFKADCFKFQSVFNNANFYVSNAPLKNNTILVLFGDLYLDIKTRQFYSVPIIKGKVLLQNKIPVDAPFYYKSSISNLE